jgi:hypothetical protein
LNRDSIAEYSENIPSQIVPSRFWQCHPAKGGYTEVVNLVVDSLIEITGGFDQRMLSPTAKVDYIAAREGCPVTTKDVR